MYLVVDEGLFAERPAWSVWFDEVVDFEGDGTWAGRVQGDLDIVVAASRIHLTGGLDALVPRPCDRCLGYFLEPVQADLSDLVVVAAGESSGEATLDEDAEVWRVAPEGRVSVTEMVRQAVLLALPTRADCGDACPALQDETGAPARAALDPRLAVLRQLLGEVDENGSTEAED